MQEKQSKAATGGMAQGESGSIIHRKARVGRQDFDARVMSPSKALRLALARSADQLFDMALSVSTVEHHGLSANAIPDRLGDDGLLVLLDGATGRRGAIKLDTQFTAALIEAQIIGEVRKTEARARPYTRTDAAMAAPFLDLVLAEFDTQMREQTDDFTPLAMRFGDRVEDARLLGLALEGHAFDLYVITADLGEGAKTGVISFVMPKTPAPNRPAKPESDDARGKSINLKKNAMDAVATLDAVLARIDLPLREVCALKPGMLLPIPQDALRATELFAPKRYLVAEVLLGQLNGLRAVRFLSDDISESKGASTAGDVMTTDAPLPDRTASTAYQDPIEGTAEHLPSEPRANNAQPEAPTTDTPGTALQTLGG